MALALYRKYRPATFAEVVGQEHVTEPLRAALAAGRINHAYLFSGPRGCGKTSSARILARSLNCVHGPTPDPCGECPSCIALAPEGPGSLDVVELDAASHGGVEDTRELRDRAFYMPAESRYRVFIIDEAHMVSTQGFNALLKIVEEPPEHLVFIFATTEPEKVLTTIRSRTHHYPFRLIPPATLRPLLEKLCAEEKVTVAPAVYPLVIRAGGGSARDSLSVLDQLLAGAGPDGVSYPNAVALLGVTDSALLDETVDALAAADGASVFGAVDKVVEAGHDPRRFAADLLQRLRDLMVLDAVPDAAAKGLIDVPEDELAAMTAQAGRLGSATVSRMAEVVHTGLVDMRGTTAPRLVLELMCARMLLPAASTEDGALLQRLERMERRVSIAQDPRPDDDSRPDQTATQTATPTAAATGGRPSGSTDSGGVATTEGRQFARKTAAAPGQPATPAPSPAEKVPAPTAPEQPSEQTAVGPDTEDREPAVASGRPAVAPSSLGLPPPPTLSSDSPRPAGQPEHIAPSAGERTTGAASARQPFTDAQQRGDQQSGERQSGERSSGERTNKTPATPPVAGQPAVQHPAAERPAVVPHLAENSAAGPPAVKPAAEQPATQPQSTPATAQSVGDLGVTDVRRVWPEVLSAVQRRRRTTQILLESATVLGVSNGALRLSMPHAGMAKRVVEPANADLLRDALREVLGVDWVIRCDAGDGDDGGGSGSSGAGKNVAGPRSPTRPEPQRRNGSADPRSSAQVKNALPPDPEPPPDEADDVPDDYGDPDVVATSSTPHDPEQAAITLLAAELGARPLQTDR